MQAAPTETTDATMAQAGFDVQADVVDRLGALHMSTRLRDMLLGQDLPNALPLAYVDIRERIVGSQDNAVEIANALADSIRTQMKKDQERIEALETRLQKVLTENERLRLDLNTVEKTLRDALAEDSVRSPVAVSRAQSPQPPPAGTNSGHLVAAPVPVLPQSRAESARTIHFAPESAGPPPVAPSRVDANTSSFRAGPSQPPFHPPPSLPFPFATVPPAPQPVGATAFAPTGMPASQPRATLPFPDVDAYRAPISSEIPATLTLGPPVPGLVPLQTLLEPFRFVVDYRNYRLTNQREEPYQNELESLDKLVTRLKALYPSITLFDGSKPLQLLALLHTLKKGFNSLGVAEAAASRALNFFVTGEAERFYDSQTSPGYLVSGTIRRFTWPHLVDAFLKRYLADDVLQEAYAKVTTIAQKPTESESDYAQRLSTAAQECNHVFTERSLVHHFVNGLRPTTRSVVTEKLRSLPPHEQSDLTVVRRIALAEGTTYRARLKDSVTKTSSTAKAKKMALAITSHPEQCGPGEPSMSPMQVDQPNEMVGPQGFYRTPGSHVPTPPAHPYTPTWVYADSPERSMDVVKRLDTIFLMAEKPMANDTPSAYDDEITKILMKPKEDAPVLTEAQRDLAFSVIPKDVWQLNCWGCRGAGHSLFTCPALTVDQRLFYAYKYYLYKVQASPSLANLYKDRLRERRAGSKPHQQGEYRPGRYDKHYAAHRGQAAPRTIQRRDDRRDYRSSNTKRSVFALPEDGVPPQGEEQLTDVAVEDTVPRTADPEPGTAEKAPGHA